MATKMTWVKFQGKMIKQLMKTLPYEKAKKQVSIEWKKYKAKGKLMGKKIKK